MKRFVCYYGYSPMNAIFSVAFILDKDTWVYFKSGDYCCKFQGLFEFNFMRYGLRIEFNLGKWFKIN